MLIHVVNPNTSTAVTALMVARARAVVPIGMKIDGMTAPAGVALITDRSGLTFAASEVVSMQPQFTGQGVIVAAFGDPGVDYLRAALKIPVIGIGEAAMRAAAAGGRRFSIVTTTPKLRPDIRARAISCGVADRLASIRITGQDPVALTNDPVQLEAALQDLVDRCIANDGAEAVIIGGGPLAAAASAIARRTPIEIIEPVPAAVAWMAARLGCG